MIPLMVFSSLAEDPVWKALEDLDRALEFATDEDAANSYGRLMRTVIAKGRPDPAAVVAEVLLEHDVPPVTRALASASLPAGIHAAALIDLGRVRQLVRRDWRAAALPMLGEPLPPLAELAPEPEDHGWDLAVGALRRTLLEGDAASILAALLDRYRTFGTGPAARYPALAWEQGRLRGIACPALADAGQLVGLEMQLEKLTANTAAFLDGRPAHDTLLYGSRGSGKSTAIRGLIEPFADRGLRLVEIGGNELEQLGAVLEAVRDRPQRFVLFVDDLSFEADDVRYRPLKTLLDGSLTSRPHNVVLYATSNRRHLVKEQFSDRPDPLDDDVHGWDTHNEKLALADRFGLVLTFPGATQKRYVEIVTSLAEHAGIRREDLVEQAVRFADWGNGYSGRTARQFIDAIHQETSG